MITIKKYMLLLFFIALATSCEKEPALDPRSIYIDPIPTASDLDRYLSARFVEPYNIAVSYRFRDQESDMNYHLVPASYEGSIRLTRLMEHLAIEPYTAISGSTDFIRQNFARQIFYIGTLAVRNNGTLVLGTAETGTKITLYNVMNLNATSSLNPDFLNILYMKTIHHEFQHILNQRKPYPSSFSSISGSFYVEDGWSTFWESESEALTYGFISPYASKNADEDFAELYALYLTNSEADFYSWVYSQGSSGEGVTALLQKLDAVKSYMLTQWGIDMDILRDEILVRMEQLEHFDQMNINIP